MLDPERVAVGVPDWDRAAALGSALGVSEIVAELMIRRGVSDVDTGRAYLQAGLEACHDPFGIRHMDRAVDLLEEALAGRQTVFIHGDYDVDGVSATVLLAEGLRALGGEVLYHVPHRITEGYGVSLVAVERAASAGARLLLTADCGSSSHEAVQRAGELGMKVVVTDHHRLPPVLPRADAFLNLNHPECTYPDKDLCGTGLAWKLMAALHQRRGLPCPAEALDLVALATIADVVPLQGENRVLVRQGLQALERMDRPGLSALAAVVGMKPGPLGAWAVAFTLAPRLNAAGRIDSADLAVDLLLERDPDVCQSRAKELEVLNTQRQHLEREIREEIGRRLQTRADALQDGVLVEAGADWHHGVLGITAARLVDQWDVPSFVAALEGNLARGSARAPEGLDLFAAMSLCSDVFVRFGGHARAAGFTVEASRLDEMRRRLAGAVRQLRRQAVPRSADFELPLAKVTLPLVRELQRLEPVGEANPKPLFLARGVRFEKVRPVGVGGVHVAAMACQDEVCLKGIAFRHGQHASELGSGDLCYDVLYTLEEDTWNGQAQPQMVIEAVLAPDPVVVSIFREDPDGEAPRVLRSGPILVDSRQVLNRRRYMESVLSQAGSVLLVAASRGQARRIREALPDAGFHVAPPDGLPEEPVAEEVIFLAPPPRLELLDEPALRGARRIHLLFGRRELEKQEFRVGVLALDRQRVTRVWKALSRRARRGVLELEDLACVVRDLEADTHRCTIREAVAVLVELGLARWESAGPQRRLRMRAGSGRRLEESPRFAELNHLPGQFQQVLQAFGQRQLDPGLQGEAEADADACASGQLG